MREKIRGVGSQNCNYLRYKPLPHKFNVQNPEASFIQAHQNFPNFRRFLNLKMWKEFCHTSVFIQDSQKIIIFKNILKFLKMWKEFCYTAETDHTSHTITE